MLCLLETRVAGQCVFAADACMRKVKDAGFCLDPDPISGKAKKGNEQEPPDQGYRQRGGRGVRQSVHSRKASSIIPANVTNLLHDYVRPDLRTMTKADIVIEIIDE